MMVCVGKGTLALAAGFAAFLAAEFFDCLPFGGAFSLDDSFVGVA